MSFSITKLLTTVGTQTGVVIAGTALIGIAGAPLGLVAAIPSEVLPHRYRSFGQAFIFTIATLAQVAGLLGIGTTCQNDATNGWRWIFYTGLIGYSLQIVMWFISYSPPKRNTKLSHERPTPDYVGYVLLAAATVLFIAALAWGGGAHPWNSGIVIGTLVAGIVLYILFGLWEWKGRSDGLMHHRLFKDRNFGLTLPA